MASARPVLSSLPVSRVYRPQARASNRRLPDACHGEDKALLKHRFDPAKSRRPNRGLAMANLAAIDRLEADQKLATGSGGYTRKSNAKHLPLHSHIVHRRFGRPCGLLVEPAA